MDCIVVAVHIQRLEQNCLKARIGSGCGLICSQLEPASARHAAVQRLALGHSLCMAWGERRYLGADHVGDGAGG